jgi:hypothetical protein
MRTILIAAVVVLAGCASKPPPAKPVFNPDAHRSYLTPGDGEIRGRAFLQAEAGVSCAESAVVVAPATAFFRQVLALAAASKMPLAGERVGPEFKSVLVGTEYASIVHTGRCDRDGNFSLTGLPPGDWLVAASMNVTQPTPATHSALLYYKVRLKPKETVQIVMTDRDTAIPR